MQGFCWKFSALCSSEIILQIDQEFTQSYSHSYGGTLFDSQCITLRQLKQVRQ